MNASRNPPSRERGPHHACNLLRAGELQIRVLLVTTVALVGLGASILIPVLLNSSPSTPSRSSPSSATRSTGSPSEQQDRQPGQHGNGTDSSGHERVASTPYAPSAPDWTVHRNEDGLYRLTFHIPLLDPGMRRSSSAVNASFFREHQRFQTEQWPDETTSNGRLTRTLRIGRLGAGLPPGIYRLRLTLTDPPITVPNAFVQTAQLMDDTNSITYRILNGSAWSYELGTRIGTPRQLQSFRRTYLRELSNQGLELLRAWTRWLKLSRGFYEIRDRKKLEKRVQPFQKVLETIQSRAKRLLNREEERNWMVHPAGSVRRKLITEARDLLTKSKALSVTILKQSLGRIPSDWPRNLLVRGFRANIDVKSHMLRYHQDTIVPLRNALRNLKGWHPPYRNTVTYLRHRLRQLGRIVETVYRLREGDLYDTLHVNSFPGRTDRSLMMEQIRLYVDALLTVHLRAFRMTFREMSPDRCCGLPDDLKPILQTLLHRELRRLGQKMGAVPDALKDNSPRTDPMKRLASLRKKYSLVPNSFPMEEYQADGNEE